MAGNVYLLLFLNLPGAQRKVDTHKRNLNRINQAKLEEWLRRLRGSTNTPDLPILQNSSGKFFPSIVDS